MTDSEKLLSDFARDKWAKSVETLDRIKGDESTWLVYAFATFGAMITGVAGILGADFREGLSPHQRLLCGSAFCTFNQVFAWFWLAQALNLRQQYYTTMGRLFEANDQVLASGGGGRPGAWTVQGLMKLAGEFPQGGRYSAFVDYVFPTHGSRYQPRAFAYRNYGKATPAAAAAEEWYLLAEAWWEKVTQPRRSKYAEIFMIAFLLVVSTLASYALFGFHATKGVVRYVAACPFGSVHLVFGAFSVLWPVCFYPRMDRRRQFEVFRANAFEKWEHRWLFVFSIPEYGDGDTLEKNLIQLLPHGANVSPRFQKADQFSVTMVALDVEELGVHSPDSLLNRMVDLAREAQVCDCKLSSWTVDDQPARLVAGQL